MFVGYVGFQNILWIKAVYLSIYPFEHDTEFLPHIHNCGKSFKY